MGFKGWPNGSVPAVGIPRPSTPPWSMIGLPRPSSEPETVQVTKNIETLIDDGGEITLGSLPPHECTATAVDSRSCLAMLLRRNGESLNTPLKRLDKAIDFAWPNEVFIDEVNDGESDMP